MENTSTAQILDNRPALLHFYYSQTQSRNLDLLWQSANLSRSTPLCRLENGDVREYTELKIIERPAGADAVYLGKGVIYYGD